MQSARIKRSWKRIERRRKASPGKELEKLTKLEGLDLQYNPDLTKAQIDELQNELLKCKIAVEKPKHPNPLPIKLLERLGNLDARPEQRRISP